MDITLAEFVDKMREAFGENTYWDVDDNGRIVIVTNFTLSDGMVTDR